MFGAPFVLGREFTQAENSPHGGSVVVISNGLWKRKYGSDPQMVGKTISIANLPYPVVGVVGAGFDTDPPADLWMPYQFDPNTNDQAHYFVAGVRQGMGLALIGVLIGVGAAFGLTKLVASLL